LVFNFLNANFDFFAKSAKGSLKANTTPGAHVSALVPRYFVDTRIHAEAAFAAHWRGKKWAWLKDLLPLSRKSLAIIFDIEPAMGKYAL